MTTVIKVLIADDSVAFRKLLTATLAQQDGIEVVGAASNGEQALELISSTQPDVLLLDVEMPQMNGIVTLQEMRNRGHKTSVIMLSSMSIHSAQETLEALSLGAKDYISKPPSTGHLQKAIDYLVKEVVPRIRYFGRSHAAESNIGSARNAAQSASVSSKLRSRAIDVVAIGSSTGGPNALAQIIPDLPADLDVPVLIVQHMPAVFTRLLAERLDRTSKLKVQEAFDGAVLRPGEVWIAPGGYHMTVQRRGTEQQLSVNQQPPENSCRPSVDVMLRSVAEVYGGRSLTVILTGMGKDGTKGCMAIKKSGGTVIAQEEQSSVVFGMPRAVAEAGLADQVVPLDEMHFEICRRLRRPSRKIATASA